VSILIGIFAGAGRRRQVLSALVRVVIGEFPPTAAELQATEV
jgi:hypothetical protein